MFAGSNIRSHAAEEHIRMILIYPLVLRQLCRRQGSIMTSLIGVNITSPLEVLSDLAKQNKI